MEVEGEIQPAGRREREVPPRKAYVEAV